MSASNIIQAIDGLVMKESLPALSYELRGLIKALDTNCMLDTPAAIANSRGPTARFFLPSFNVARDTYGFPAGGAQNYVERQTQIVVDKKSISDFGLTRDQLTLYNLDDKLSRDEADTRGTSGTMSKASVISCAGKVINELVNDFSSAGFRFLSTDDTAVTLKGESMPPALNTSIFDIKRMITNFSLFGGAGLTFHCFLHPAVYDRISGSQFQYFTPAYNDQMRENGRWDVKRLESMNQRVLFYTTEFIQPYITGTVAETQLVPYNIIGVNQSTVVLPNQTITTAVTELTLSNAALAVGLTIKAGDQFDIVPAAGQSQVTFINRPTGAVTPLRAQARVVEDVTVTVAGQVTIKVIDPLVRNSLPAPNPVTDSGDTINRAINVNAGQEDQVRFVKTHLPGFVFIEGYGKFISVPIDDNFNQLNAKTFKDDHTGLNLTVAMATDLSTWVNQQAFAMQYGYLGIPEGFAKLVFSPNIMYT